MTTGDRIRIFREAKGITQEELGILCHTTKQTIQKYEAGIVTNIPLDRVELLAKHLGTTPEILVGWKTEIADDSKSKLIDMVSDMDEAQLKEVMRYIQFVKQS